MTLDIPSDVKPGDITKLARNLNAKFGADWHFNLENVQIIDFHGRSGDILDAIGVFYR